MLWNSNFFITLESMKLLRVLTDVWLPDFKFGPGRCAMTLAKTPWYWETVTRNIALIADWGEDFSIRHLVMPNHVACCTYPVLEWIAEHVPAAPVNVMAQFHPDNFCDPASAKYRDKYAEIAGRPQGSEIRGAYRYAARLGLHFETVTFDRFSPSASPGCRHLRKGVPNVSIESQRGPRDRRHPERGTARGRERAALGQRRRRGDHRPA